MSSNPFVLPAESYKRDINVLKHYTHDSATYLSIMSGKPYSECIEFIKNSLRPGGQFEFKDPECYYLERGENGDREKKTGTLSEYIGSAIKDKDLIAPTLTTYLNPDVCKSILVTFIDGNVKARGTAKKAQFAAKVAGNKAIEAIKKIEQTNKKLNNNSISGAHVSASTPLFNKTAHSTLTSNCRTTSGYGNANNEKFLCGNRHYWSPDIVRNNIISIINNTDLDQLARAMEQFGIRHPTVSETIDCVRYSTDLYWKGHKEYKKINAFINKLTDIQRSAFVYVGDLYHLMKYNEQVVRTFLDRLTMKAINTVCLTDNIETIPEDYKLLAAQICSEELKGTSVRDIIGTPAYDIYVATVENVNTVLNDYFPMIRALWVTPNVPASVAVFPDSIRRAAVTSDTDSTIFTVQDWVIWHRGKLGFDQKADATAATCIFLASQTITHVLARMSANFGIETKRIHQVAMKNEFKFAIFTPTQVAKHYYALISCQEGNVFANLEKEIKGVHLKSSNAPKVITKEAQRMMEFIMTSVMEDKKISINFILKWIADIERDVIRSIAAGSYEYFRMGQVKTPDSYTEKEESSPYQQYLLWEKVFAPKYGSIPPPPYTSVKVSVDIDTPTKTRAWLSTMKDREIADKLEAYLLSKNKKNFGSTFMLPEQCISSRGIPIEILDAVGVRKIVLDTTGIFYIILETLGIYMLNGKNTRLVSDHA
ncbi:MAG: hypothetical protein ACD_84C00036G0002 [uncultured bacterium]|nr:MAG: hypothetical protein ACD_84C00036G0002 [uncultured bacterium]